MPIPKTFSAPGSAFSPSIEDRLRYAVWLMLMADDANRAAYSFDPADETRGIRIYQGRAGTDPQGVVHVPQQIVGVTMTASSFKFNLSMGGERRVDIAVIHLEANNTSYVDTDVAAPTITPETRIARTANILMKGTIHSADRLPGACEVIDPYDSPLLPDGTYDQTQWRILTNRAPGITPLARQSFPIKQPQTLAAYEGLHPIRDFAVAYGLVATYTIEIQDREHQELGGWRP